MKRCEKRTDRGADNLREIRLATETSLYLDAAIIVLVYIAAMICSRKKWVLGLYVMTGAYLLIFSWLVLFSRRPFQHPEIQQDLFWSYREAFGKGLTIRRLGLARQILLNILLYIPLGILLPAVLKSSRHPVLYPIILGFLLSLLTESIQYIARLGLAEFDDLFNNGVGLLIGMAAFLLADKKKRVRS